MLNKLSIGSVAVMLGAMLLTGCVGAAVGGGAMVATATLEERGLKVAATDLLTRAHINDLWLTHNEEMYTSLGSSVIEGRALLTGKVRTHQMRLDAVSIAPDSELPPELTPGQYARLTVTDEGIGMNPDTLEKIFDPFFTTKQPGQGTGLAQAICSLDEARSKSGCVCPSRPSRH